MGFKAQIKGNDREDIRKLADYGDSVVTTVNADIDDLAGTGRTYETVQANAADIATVKGANWTSGMTLKAHDDTIKGHTTAIDALERSGSTVTVAGVVTDADRDVTLTIKNGAASPAAVAAYAMIGVKVTKGDGNGVDTGDPAVIDTDLVTSTGLVVSSGEQLVPSNGAAISNAGNATLIAFTNADGILVVTPTAKTNNLFIFVHFIMPDGTVEKSAEIKLKEV